MDKAALCNISSDTISIYSLELPFSASRGDRMKTLKQKVSITLDEGVIEEIKAMAEEDDRSFSQYINLVLRKYLNETKQPAAAGRKQKK